MYKYLIFIFFSISCQTDTKQYLIDNGIWAIESVSVDNESVKYLFADNLLSFKKKEVCKVPFLQEGMEIGDQNGEWLFNEQKSTITITSKNEFINGTYKICFERDVEDQVVVLHLNSENVSIVAHTRPRIDYESSKIPMPCNVNE